MAGGLLRSLSLLPLLLALVAAVAAEERGLAVLERLQRAFEARDRLRRVRVLGIILHLLVQALRRLVTQPVLGLRLLRRGIRQLALSLALPRGLGLHFGRQGFDAVLALLDGARFLLGGLFTPARKISVDHTSALSLALPRGLGLH